MNSPAVARETGAMNSSGGGLEAQEDFEPRREARKRLGTAFKWLCFSAVVFGIVALVVLLTDVFIDGYRWVDWSFLTSYPSRFPEQAGIRAALLGTLWMMGLVALISFPLGVGAAIYLEEYAPSNWFTRTLQMNISNLAAVPSVVYGILGLAVFVRFMALGQSVLAGALTLSLLILPVTIIAAQEAIRAVPGSLRQASYGIGATKWQTIRHQVLPVALPGILTGTILSLSRAIGETAPVLLVGAVTFIAFDPEGPLDQFTVLPIQIFNWAARPEEQFHAVAAGAILVLLVILLAMNATAIYLRNRYRQEL